MGIQGAGCVPPCIMLAPRICSAHDLIALLASSDYIGRQVLWDQWRNTSHLLSLLQAMKEFREHAGNVVENIRSLAQEKGPDWYPNVFKHINTGLRTQAARAIFNFSRPKFEMRVMHQLERFQLEGPPTYMARC